jgi:hypothetical protein
MGLAQLGSLGISASAPEVVVLAAPFTSAYRLVAAVHRAGRTPGAHSAPAP